MGRLMAMLLWFCLFGTAQSYLGLYDVIHEGAVWQWQTSWMAIQNESWGAQNHYRGHESVWAVLCDYLWWSLPLLALMWGLRRRRCALWLCVGLYALGAMLWVNVGIYHDLVASWSTYSVGELYGATIMKTWPWWLGSWFGFMCVWAGVWQRGRG